MAGSTESGIGIVRVVFFVASVPVFFISILKPADWPGTKDVFVDVFSTIISVSGTYESTENVTLKIT